MAKAHYLQTILFSVTLDAAMSDPTHLEQVKAAVRQGGSASGIHLEAFEPAEAGAVLKQ
ncbi:hypothetical protein [uncultured Tateyamaria sp.]|uniref:hypothetical protein n=1 Tax=uncultured Tateyamaria sp. TaxID=455651 RepID=UPI002637AC9B|nr:hypothetical protein [uncultured Tateyamaria sp.]